MKSTSTRTETFLTVIIELLIIKMAVIIEEAQVDTSSAPYLTKSDAH